MYGGDRLLAYLLAHLYSVFPVCTGVILSISSETRLLQGVPRVYGGDPDERVFV
ncbi:hypothetical protein FC36_GL001893 [Ligilactobacillus equi DSM 15833 = JCM 10991]|uniref:Uncharacterized protein n=1 Tax=Ligilactobacillus equi DSM 15833 = JCM 10991 TaxID=1423740 RepID=A0A0R1TCA1_9LACO|nr:hypothetical protein FC36_GL001893 [Ligilactobacillus equi DSM 15833 = JCM 10991]